MVEIPKQLQNEKFRFVLIATKSKAPFEIQWTNKNNYSFNHKKIINHKGNFGIVCGYGGLVVLDVDNPQFKKEFDDKTNTFTTETGSGGRHYYFICGKSFLKNYYVLGEGVGELRVSNSQVLIPGCIHPNGKEYKVLRDVKIQHITKIELKELLGDLLNKSSMISVDNSRSGVEWGEVCSMIQAGYNYEDCDKEMRLLGYDKWINEKESYRVGTYCNALKVFKRVR